MNITEIFIRRPVMTTLVMAAIVIFGAVAYMSLPVADLPNVDYPTISVSAALPGASPETMAASVATPLERQFSTISGLTSMNSTNSQGTTSITLQFDLSKSIDAAAQDVNACISQATKMLPQGMPSPPSYMKVNPASTPILYMAMTSETLPLSTIDYYAETLLAENISMVYGVSQVQVYGGKKWAVRIKLDPNAMATKGVGIDEVNAAVQKQNVNTPVGLLQGAAQTFTVQANGQLMTAADYMPMIITYRNGAPIRLQDVGTAYDSVESDKFSDLFNGKESVVIAIQRQPGTNTVKIVNAILKMMPKFEHQLPAAIKLEVFYDDSKSIRDSVRDIQFTILVAIILVILVIFLFLRNLSATVIPSLALPIALLATFVAMNAFAFSLDTLSLMALILSVGFIVDDAIVMLENVVRHMEEGEAPMEAALKGSKQIVPTIVSMTLSLAAVFIPLLFMSGILGRLMNEFSVTIVIAILASMVISLSLTPMLASRFLKIKPKDQQTGFYAKSEKVFTDMVNIYDKALSWVLKRKLLTMVVASLFLVAALYLFKVIPKGFIPDEDKGMLMGFTEAAQGISFESMVAHQTKLADIIMKEPGAKGYLSLVGTGGPNVALNTGRLIVLLKDSKDRKNTADQIVDDLRPKLTTVPGIKAFVQNMPAIPIGGMVTKSQYQFTLQSSDIDSLYHHSPILETKLRQIPLLEDVASDLQISAPQANVEIDRDKAAAVGVTAAQVEDAFYTAYGPRQISYIYSTDNTYKVLMQLEDKFQLNPSSMDLLYIRSASGKLVPLSAIARVTQDVGPQVVNHVGQLPSVTLSFNIKANTPLNVAMDEVNKAAREVLPDEITSSFQGTAQAFKQSMSGLPILLALAVIVIYIVLGILYENFIYPLVILAALPFALFGALMTLMIFNAQLTIYAYVGVIMLIGLVMKNGIMVVDFALEAQSQGKSPEDAVHQASLIRFRPIMMTTMSAFMGTLPIALGMGAGGDSRQPLGLAVVGGLVFSQLLTFFVTPVIFIYMERLQRRLSAKKENPTLEAKA